MTTSSALDTDMGTWKLIISRLAPSDVFGWHAQLPENDRSGRWEGRNDLDLWAWISTRLAPPKPLNTGEWLELQTRLIEGPARELGGHHVRMDALGTENWICFPLQSIPDWINKARRAMANIIGSSGTPLVTAKVLDISDLMSDPFWRGKLDRNGGLL